MNKPDRFTATAICFLTVLCTFSPAKAAPQEQQAKQILQATGVRGGLVVHLGCGDGNLTAALRAGDSYLVHGLALKPQDLTTARASIRDAGLYGPVSADLLEGGMLPYIENSVNLIIADGPTEVPEEEIMRVLVPRGVAYLKEDGKWTKTVKPRPDNIDEWTHYLHDSTNNAVAHDTAIGPPRHLQWEGSPRYSRHHEFTSSVAAVVSASGRVFSIMDMGSRASIHMPPKWRLTARDAFNGIVLWEKPIKLWFNHLWPLKDGPAQPPRRLVAVGDSVYVTLGLDARVSRLDAATGKTLKSYPGTEFTEEILYSDGALFLLKNDESMNPDDYYPKLMVCWDEKNRTMKEAAGWLLKPEKREIIALDAETGEVLWKAEHKVEPLTLAADDKGVYFHNWTRVVCLNRKTGERNWQSEPIVPRENMGYVYGPTLVAYDDVVLFADGRLKRKIYALAKKDGKPLWEAPHYPAGHAGSPEDLLVADGLVWCGKIAGGGTSGVFTGRDPRTGEVKREFEPDIKTYWFHHRCYRAKATDEYFLASRTGIEFVDIRNKTWEAHHWVRGACSYGVMPCNGLIYAPPSPCACYLDSKLSGFCALAPSSQRRLSKTTEAENRLFKGPAYGDKLGPKGKQARQWPTYRHDTARSGATKAGVNLPLSEKWQADVGGQLTSPVVAAGRVYVASQDTDTLYALKARNGGQAWTFTAGAKIDSPPTVYRGLVIFGCADGKVYCLRASDGTLAWRFRAGPRDMRLVSYGRLESVWPIHGSVLAENDTVYCVAGRCTYLDGGLRFYRLDAATGRMLCEKVLYDQQNPQKDVKVLNMPVALPDVLSTDGKMIYMRQQAFDMEGNRVQILDPSLEPFERATRQLGQAVHLFSPTGFLDDDAWHRSYWVYGRAFSSGCNWWFRAGRYAPAGRMLVFDSDRVYGFGREPGLFVWSPVLENHLFCSAKQADAESIARVKEWSQKSGRSAVFDRSFTRHAAPESRLAPQQHWSVTHPPLHARAMILAGDTLFLAGPPDVLSEDEAFETPFDPKTIAKVAEQDAAYEGKRGALLMGVSASEGKPVFRVDLPAPPVWDGMAAAGGRLYIATADGRLTCMGPKN
ncbi:MAG: PQQ-binding-like beta-propeller repeat protein [Phycisphaerae bacterium]|nr:PQQ-binding-like beta-propeller repeat protein [Phycisphaerae bacterium]